MGFISLHFGLFGVGFWAPPPQVAKNCPFAQRPYNGFISARTGSILQFLAFWAFISLHFGLVGLHFLAFWLCGPSFPCILAFWAFISLHFGLVGLHFLAFWPFRGQLLGPPPQVAKNGPFAQRPYNGFIRAVTGSILQFLAFRAFISLHFGLVGLHFLAFWPCGSSFPCVLAFWAFISFHFGLVGLHFLAFWPFRGQLLGPPPQVAKKLPVCPTSLQWIYQRRDRLHFAVSSLLGLHFVAFWPCGPLFPCILALWAFISLPFAFWLCGPSFPCILGLWAFISLHFGLFGVSFCPPPTSCQKWPVCPTSLQWIYLTGSILQFLAFWAFISLHFGLVGLHFLAFWPCRSSFPCVLAFWAFISFHFGLVGLHFLAFWPFRGQLLGPPPTSCQKWPVCPTSLQWI